MRTVIASYALVALLLLASPVAAQRPSAAVLPPGTSSISGHVVASDTGKPIANALVEIVIYENVSSRFRQVTTDVQGKFAFTGLPTGHYQLAASATRYMRMQFGQQQPGPAGLFNPVRVIELAEGQAFTAADFALARFGAIEGVVTDEFGDPVPNVSMQVSQIQNAGGRRRLVPANVSNDAGPPRPTDDRGQFRIGGLAPGEYYVEALSGAFADPNATGGFAVTYFPGTAKASSAQAVSVTSGHDTKGVSFALTPATMMPVAGTLVDGEGKPLVGGNMMLMPSERAGASLFMMVRTVAGEGSQFAFRNVPPGQYTIQAYGAPVSGAGNLGAFTFGYLTFTVGEDDTTHVIVRVPAPRTLRGRITFEGEASPAPKPSGTFVSARPVDFESAPIGGGPPPVTIHDDWTFEVGAMSGLRVVIANARPNWILRRALLDGKDVTDTPLDLRERDVNSLELVLTTQTTTVTATVKVPKDTTVSDYNLLVFTTDDTKWTLWSRYVTFARPGQQGTVTVKDLPAGSYVAVAVGVLSSGEWQDPDFLRQQRASADAVPFTLLDGESKALQLTVKR